MNASASFDVRAEAFRIMTGYMAPGKDCSAAAGPPDYAARLEAFRVWTAANNACVSAMLRAFDTVFGDDE